MVVNPLGIQIEVARRAQGNVDARRVDGRNEALRRRAGGGLVVDVTEVEVPDGASSLKLEDPRLAMMMARPAVSEAASEAEKPFVYLAPRAGTVLMWESWLRHEVPPNAAKSERISISFNYA